MTCLLFFFSLSLKTFNFLFFWVWTTDKLYTRYMLIENRAQIGILFDSLFDFPAFFLISVKYKIAKHEKLQKFWWYFSTNPLLLEVGTWTMISISTRSYIEAILEKTSNIFSHNFYSLMFKFWKNYRTRNFNQKHLFESYF